MGQLMRFDVNMPGSKFRHGVSLYHLPYKRSSVNWSGVELVEWSVQGYGPLPSGRTGWHTKEFYCLCQAIKEFKTRRARLLLVAE